MSTPKDAAFKERQRYFRERNKLKVVKGAEAVFERPLKFGLPIKGAKELERERI